MRARVVDKASVVANARPSAGAAELLRRTASAGHQGEGGAEATAARSALPARGKVFDWGQRYRLTGDSQPTCWAVCAKSSDNKSLARSETQTCWHRLRVAKNAVVRGHRLRGLRFADAQADVVGFGRLSRCRPGEHRSVRALIMEARISFARAAKLPGNIEAPGNCCGQARSLRGDAPATQLN